MVGKYDKQVGCRLSSADHDKLIRSGYSLRHAVEYFITDYYRNHEKINLQLKLKELNADLDYNKKKSYSIKMEIQRLNDEIKNIHEKLGNAKTVENEVTYYDEKVQRAVESVQEIFDSKPLIDNVLDLDEVIFKLKADNLGINIDEFKEILVENVK